MKSKFKFGAYLVVVLSTIFSIMMILSLSVYFFGIAIPIGIYLLLNFWLILVGIWLVYGELRTKVIFVYIGYDLFTVKSYFGLGPSKTWYFNEIDGYLTAILPASGGESYEYLYLIKNSKKVIKLSQFYHSNYTDLKNAISSAGISNLGCEDFSYSRELKEIFR